MINSHMIILHILTQLQVSVCCKLCFHEQNSLKLSFRFLKHPRLHPVFSIRLLGYGLPFPGHLWWDRVMRRKEWSEVLWEGGISQLFYFKSRAFFSGCRSLRDLRRGTESCLKDRKTQTGLKWISQENQVEMVTNTQRTGTQVKTFNWIQEWLGFFRLSPLSLAKCGQTQGVRAKLTSPNVIQKSWQNRM